jgi:hypothetical protein
MQLARRRVSVLPPGQLHLSISQVEAADPYELLWAVPSLDHLNWAILINEREQAKHDEVKVVALGT